MLWVDKHAPKRLSELSGNGPAVKALQSWFSSWAPGGKAALLFGPPGVGKTTAAHLLAKEAGAEIIETNASNYRNKKEIDRVVGSAATQRSLFDSSGEGKKIILVDEVDGISGRKDYGGVSAISALIKESKYPIILTANNAIVSGNSGRTAPFNPEKWERKFIGKADNRFKVFAFLKEVYFSETGEKPNDKAIWATVFSTEKKAGGKISAFLEALPIARGSNWWEWNPKLSPLKTATIQIEFSSPSTGEIEELVRKVSKAEGISLESGVSEEIAEKTGGDARAAITLLEALGRGKETLRLADLRGIATSKERRGNLEDAVRIILATGSSELSRDAFRGTESQPEELASYLSENILRFYSGNSLKDGYRALSDADIVSGRIISSGSQSLLPYRISFLTGGVSVAKENGRIPIAGKITNPLSKYSPSIVKKRRLRKQVHGKIRKKFPLAKGKAVMRLALIDPAVKEALEFDSEETEFVLSLSGKRMKR